VDKYETLYISVNPERGLHFTAQLKHVVIVISGKKTVMGILSTATARIKWRY
jgi:hypothetical protein